MGIRASFKLVPRDVARKIYNEKDEDKVFETLEQCETILYDFCTDALFDCYKRMPRLTRSKLPCECDIIMGRMGKTAWETFSRAVHQRASKFIDEGFTKSLWNATLYIPENKYKITGGIDWFSAFYQCRHILRIVDWSKYVIEFEIG